MKNRAHLKNQICNGSVMDCGGKRSATPLSHGRKISVCSVDFVRAKALSPLPPLLCYGVAGRSASAVQDAGRYL